MNASLASVDDEEDAVLKMAARGLILARIAQVKVIERIMEMEFQRALLDGLARGKTAEEHFGFAARDVSHVERCDRGECVYRLYGQTLH